MYVYYRRIHQIYDAFHLWLSKYSKYARVSSLHIVAAEYISCTYSFLATGLRLHRVSHA